MALRLGITGGIGSGKSYVCRMLESHFEIPVYYCDIHAAIITRSMPEVMEQIEALLPGIYDAEGDMDKARLANYLFASEENAARINQIIHPAVRADLRSWIAARDHLGIGIVAMESAILYESGFDKEVDRILYIDTPQETRIQRVMQRDGLAREQITQRMAMQQNDQARKKADFVIQNDGQADLLPSLTEIIESLTRNN